MNLGMKDAFDNNNANFSKMAETELYVSERVHKADIEFSEDGIKAAAVTVFSMISGSEERNLINEIIDKPFMLIIRDRETKNIWFVQNILKKKEIKKAIKFHLYLKLKLTFKCILLNIYIYHFLECINMYIYGKK